MVGKSLMKIKKDVRKNLTKIKSRSIKGSRFARVPARIYSKEHLSKIVSDKNNSKIRAIIKRTTKKKIEVENNENKGVPKVYVLELEGGYIYVGKSDDVKNRVENHMTGKGAMFTRSHKPTGKMIERLGNLEGHGDGPERDETLRQMLRNGANKVRGWKYCKPKHSKWDLRDIESNIRELLDLCRKCGRKGHFATFCKFKTDRLGSSILRKKFQKKSIKNH